MNFRDDELIVRPRRIQHGNRGASQRAAISISALERSGAISYGNCVARATIWFVLSQALSGAASHDDRRHSERRDVLPRTHARLQSS